MVDIIHDGSGDDSRNGLDALFGAPQLSTDENGRHWDADGREYRAVTVEGETTFVPLPAVAGDRRVYDLYATYQGKRVRVLQALEGAQWAIELDGVAVSVPSQSLSGMRSERSDELALAVQVVDQPGYGDPEVVVLTVPADGQPWGEPLHRWPLPVADGVADLPAVEQQLAERSIRVGADAWTVTGFGWVASAWPVDEQSAPVAQVPVAPAWSSTSHAEQVGRVLHCREGRPVEGSHSGGPVEPVVPVLSQVDELVLDAGRVRVVRGPVTVQVEDLEFGIREAVELAHSLLQLVEQVADQDVAR